MGEGVFASAPSSPVTFPPLTSLPRERRKKKMTKKYDNKYWETETPETIEFGNGNFMRCYDKAGKLQFGTKFKNKEGEEVFQVKYVLDREALFSDDEAPSYLRGTINDWEDLLEAKRDD